MLQSGPATATARGDIGVPLETRRVAWVRSSGQINDDVRCWRTISFGSLPFYALRALDLEFKEVQNAQETPKSRGKAAGTST